MNRSMMRMSRRVLEAENRNQPPSLAEVPIAAWPASVPPGLIQVWRSRGFLVQAYEAESPALFRLSVNRTSINGDQWVDNITWDDLQRLKREAGYGDYDAIEVYPADRDMVNVANMRHLWLLEPGHLPFAWRKRT